MRALRMLVFGLVCLVRGHVVDERTDHDSEFGSTCFCPTCVFWRRCQRCLRWVPAPKERS